MAVQKVPVADDRRQVAPEIARSWLLVPASRKEAFWQAFRSPADQVVLDLEDGVGQEHKSSARSDVIEWLGEGGSAWVRVNDRSTPYWADDIDQLAEAPGLVGVMLAKAESADDVEESFTRLGGRHQVLPLIESARGIEEAASVARARGTFRLAFGSGDYRHDTGTEDDELAMAYPRSRLVVASRCARIPGPIDGPSNGFLGPELDQRIQSAVALGVRGKLCLDPAQLDSINRGLTPAPHAVEQARATLEDFHARGRVIRDGSDAPRIRRAEEINRLATLFHCEPVGGTGAGVTARRRLSDEPC